MRDDQGFGRSRPDEPPVKEPPVDEPPVFTSEHEVEGPPTEAVAVNSFLFWEDQVKSVALLNLDNDM